MSDRGEGRGPSPGAGEENAATGDGQREAFDRSMRDFTEGATALAAAALRLEMMMLEEMRAMADDFAGAFGEAGVRGSKDDARERDDAGEQG